MKSIISIALLLASAFVLAAPGPREHRRGPPPEALEACKDKAAGSKVEMKTPRGDTVQGTCRMVMIPDRD
ncbi:MAG: hypothetical protein V4633_24320 [Pseudomonadota bacterium]